MSESLPPLTYLVLGGGLLLAVVLPNLLARVWLTAPVVLVGVGALIGLAPLPQGVAVDPVKHATVVQHIAELTVLMALMGVGLALDRPLSLRNKTGWPHWSATWKLLMIAMPLCIGAVFLLGWGLLGLAAPAALLLAAALAPTDPVLASDVQVEGPATNVDQEEIAENDEVRFALTSEAGLNDGLAFPFVHGALLLAAGSVGAATAWEWVGWFLLGKVLIGVLVGVTVGWVLAKVAFRAPARSLRVAETGDPLLALAALLLAYGAAEALHGYGFLAVFAGAMSLRAAERTSEFHEHMHGVVERLERLFTLIVLLFVGMGLTDGGLAHLDWRGVTIAVALILVIRPLAGYAALRVGRWRMADERHRPLEELERRITAFFGVRGIGSIYYVAYALAEHHFDEARWLWSTVLFTVVLSVVVHGIAATPLIDRLERRREALSA